jgi:hypothetical protein
MTLVARRFPRKMLETSGSAFGASDLPVNADHETSFAYLAGMSLDVVHKISRVAHFTIQAVTS